MIDTAKGFTMVRELDATPHAIWTAWTVADEAAKWWHPRGATTPRESVEIDARVGGRYTYAMVADERDGEPVVTAGVYSEVDPEKRLVFTWGNPADDDSDRPVIALTIEPLGDLTRLTFELRGFDGMPGDGFIYDGWESALDVLVEYLGQNEVLG